MKIALLAAMCILLGMTLMRTITVLREKPETPEAPKPPCVKFDGRELPVHTLVDEITGRTYRCIWWDRGLVILPEKVQ